MLFTKKFAIVLLSIALLFSIAANVYSFGNRSEVNNNLIEQIKHLENEIDQKNQEINDYKEERSTPEKSASDTNKEGNNDEVQEEKSNANNQINVDNDLVNTAHRFIEYAFDSNPETYVSKKKLAKNYMTDPLFDTLFQADGVDEAKQTINAEVESITVYLDTENIDEAIVHYVMNEEILSTGYEETIEKFVKLKFVLDGDQVKVSEIESINYDEGGI